jgi:hypothetical protein
METSSSNTHKNNPLKGYRFLSFTSLCYLSVISFIFIDLISIIPSPFAFIVPVQALITILLLMAWKEKKQRFNFSVGFILLAIFFFRLVFRSALVQQPSWGFRAGTIATPFINSIEYILILCLHPTSFDWFQKTVKTFHQMKTSIQIAFACLTITALTILFSLFSSNHITRDGLDWIQRAVNDNWYEYIREPLTIGMYTFGSYIGWNLFGATSYQVIQSLSIMAGIWFFIWLFAFTFEKFLETIDKILTTFLVVSSGGLFVLFFGHIEVYPIFIAGILPSFYFAQRYLNNKNGILYVGTSFSLALLLHLSAGWLIPAFFLLPFIHKNNKKFHDLFSLTISFFTIQLIFWLLLFIFAYQASFQRIFSELHEQFFVGPDRGMFIPLQSVFSWFHIEDMMNEYLYLSIPCCILVPIVIVKLFKSLNNETLFYGTAALGYLIYSLLWNYDRGFPEDWDLFSPLVLFILLFQIQVLLMNPTNQDEKENNRIILYITTLGTLYFSILQIIFHHTIPFKHVSFY